MSMRRHYRTQPKNLGTGKPPNAGKKPIRRLWLRWRRRSRPRLISARRDRRIVQPKVHGSQRCGPLLRPSRVKILRARTRYWMITLAHARAVSYLGMLQPLPQYPQSRHLTSAQCLSRWAKNGLSHSKKVAEKETRSPTSVLLCACRNRPRIRGVDLRVADFD